MDSSERNPYLGDEGAAGSRNAGANPYLDLPDWAFDELDEASPVRAHAEMPADGTGPWSADAVQQASGPLTPPAGAPAFVGQTPDPDATVFAPAPETPAPAPQATTGAPDPDATVYAPMAGAPAAAPAAVDPDATVYAPAPQATTAVPDPDATVFAPAAPTAAAPKPAPAAADPLGATACAPAAAMPAPNGPRSTAVHARVPEVQPGPAPDLSRAEMARRMLDADRSLYDDYDAGFGGAARGGVMGERWVKSRWEERASKGPLARKRLRFWRWFRTVPILLMLLAAAASWALSALPASSLRQLFYPVHYTDAIESAASRMGVDPALVAAVIKSESNWIDSAQSAAGAQGLMQVMPSTAKELVKMGYVDPSRFDPDNLTDPETNIAYGTAYLAYLTNLTGSEDEAIAAYNAGPGATQDWKDQSGDESPQDFSSVIQYPETKLYLEKVKEAYGHYQELYPEGLES